MTPQEIIKTVALAELAGKRFTKYTYALRLPTTGHNMMGNEASAPATEGTVLAIQDGVVVVKVKPTQFEGFLLADLASTDFNLGDKVSISFNGFNGTEKIEVASTGFRTFTFGRKQLKPLVDDEYIKQMTEQLSEMRLSDGRRGLHLLHDLKYTNFAAGSSMDSTRNPYVSFDVIGRKFQGNVRIELVLGMDAYAVTFTPVEGTLHIVDYVLFDEFLPLIEETCDSSLSKVAAVMILKRARKPKLAA